MLGADSFPYRNITVNNEVRNDYYFFIYYNINKIDCYQILTKALEALERLYFVGIQEYFQESISLYIHMMNISNNFFHNKNYTFNIENIPLERKDSNKKSNHLEGLSKSDILNNQTLIERMTYLNIFDYILYKAGNYQNNIIFF